MADVYVVATLSRSMRFVLFQKVNKASPAFTKYFLRVHALPEFQSVLGVFPENPSAVRVVFPKPVKCENKTKN